MKLNQKQFKLILGSQSPRRKALLADLGYTFVQKAIDIDESYPLDLPIREVAEYLSKKKSMAYDALETNELLITSDTTVCLGKTILNKAADRQEAIAMLNLLSNQEHDVITGVCLRSLDKTDSFSVSTRVRMKALTQEEIIHYVDQYQPMDKAGAYGIQEWIGYIGVEGIIGSFYNVMGLPVKELYEAIEAF